MPNSPTFEYIQEQVKIALALGVIEQVPEQEKRKFATFVNYLVTPEGIKDLENVLGNIEKISTGATTFIIVTCIKS